MHLYQTAGEREMGKGPVKLGQRHNVSQAATVRGQNGAPAVSHMLVQVLKQAAKQSDIIACPNQNPPNVGFPRNFNKKLSDADDVFNVFNNRDDLIGIGIVDE